VGLRVGSRQPICIGHPDQALPQNWAWAPLTSLAKLESGHTPRKTVEEYWSGGKVPWICLQDIRDAHGKVLFDTKFKTTPLGIQNSSARLLPEGTVCFSRDISVGFTTIMGKEMATTQHFANWVCGPSIYNKYLMQALVASRHTLTKSGEGTVVRTIYMPALERFHIALPPLNEQRRIVARIEELTARSKSAREALQAIPPLLEKFRQSVLAAAFRGDLTAEWRRQNPDVEPAEVLLERIRKARFWSPRGVRSEVATDRQKDLLNLSIPDTWKACPLGQLTALQPGYAFKSEWFTKVGIRLLRGINIAPGSIRWEDVACLAEDRRPEFPEYELATGDIVIAMDRPLISSGLKVALITEADAGALLLQRVGRFRPVQQMHSGFLYQYLTSPLFIRHISKQATGTQLPHISQNDIETATVLLPPWEEQVAISRTLDHQLSWVESVSACVRAAAARMNMVDQSILAKAFRGELVPQDPADEPASRLLERIRAERTQHPPARQKRK